MEFKVNGKRAGDAVKLNKPGRVTVSAKVAFSSETPLEAAYGAMPEVAQRVVGDTVVMYADPPAPGEGGYRPSTRTVELVVNGRVVERRRVPADDKIHEVEFKTRIDRSSWVALREFPQMHTNPVNVLVGGKPIRASRRSAQWCIDSIEHLWAVRGRRIADDERMAASLAYDKALKIYRTIAEESPADR